MEKVKNILYTKKLVFFLAIFIFCFFLACLSVDYDYDLFARLIVGERFIEEGILPFKDILSYTPTHPWFDHEWGSGVIFYIILKYMGPFGLVLFQALMMFGTAFFVIKTQNIQKHSFPASLSFILIFLTVFFHLNNNLIRCQLFSFLFFSIFLYILEKYRRKNSKLIWLLPWITVFWNNVHGGVVAGLGLIFIFMISAFLEQKKLKDYLFVLIISTILLIVNPYGIKYLSFLFSAVTMNRKYIVEWWSPLAAYHYKRYVWSLAFILYSIITYIFKSFKTKTIDYTKIFILLVTTVESCLYVKMMSFGIISVTALCYNEIFSFIKALKKFLKPFEKSLYLTVFILLLVIPLYSPQYPRLTYRKFPVKEVEFLKLNNIKGNILTTFGHGSYVSYKLFDNNLIYMDGRYEEVYDNHEFLMLRDYELVRKNWHDIIANYPTEILMPMKNLAIYHFLNLHPYWVKIYEGHLCGIFVRKDSPYLNQKLLEPSNNIDYYKKYMFKGIRWGKKTCQTR